MPFRNGEPVAASDSKNSWTTIMANPNLSACPGGCFRPVGLAWDSKGRLYVSSDSTGEVFMISKNDGSGIDGVSGSGAGSGSGSETGSADDGQTSEALAARALSLSTEQYQQAALGGLLTFLFVAA